MSKAGAWALTAGGLASAFVGTFIGFAFGIPAVGLSQYGRYPVEVTAVGEGFAAMFYFFGAIPQIRGGRVLEQRQRTTRKGLLLALVPIAYGSVGVIVLTARHGDWEAIPIAFTFVALVFAPILAGMLSVRMDSRSSRNRGSGPARRRNGRLPSEGPARR